MISSGEGLATENPMSERSGRHGHCRGETNKTTQESDTRFVHRSIPIIRRCGGEDKHDLSSMRKSAIRWECSRVLTSEA